MRIRLVPLLVLIALVTSGCFVARGRVVLEEEAGGQPPVVAPPLPPAPNSPIPAEPDGGIGDGGEPLPDQEPPGDGGARQVEPQGNAIDPRPVDWESAEIDRDAMTITLTWWSGVEPCTILDRIDIHYADDVVTVTVWEGLNPDAAAMTCIAMAEQKQATVSLEEDIGQRTLVDGAEG